MKRSTLLYILLLLCYTGCAQVRDTALRALIKDYATSLDNDLRADKLHGSISVAIIKDNRIVGAGAIGHSDDYSTARADTGTLYRIGSISKTFTAVLMMKLVEEGTIRLDDPVERYLPEVKRIHGYSDSTRFTFLQLASHTSGLCREPENPNARDGDVDKWDKKLLAALPSTRFAKRSGASFLYSNVGYSILGLALSRAAGQPFIKLMQDKVLAPLHMVRTFYQIPKELKNKVAQGIYNNIDNEVDTYLPYSERNGIGYSMPNGGLYSTPSDLAKLVIAIMQRSPILSRQDWELMETVPRNGSEYGLGLQLHWGQTDNLEGHSGVEPGYTAQFMIDVYSKYAVILMRNYNHGNTKLQMNALQLLRNLRKIEQK